MVTGLHRQILYRKTSAVKLPRVAVVAGLIYCLGVTVLSLVFSGMPAQSTSFITEPASYLGLLAVLWAVYAVSRGITPLRRFSLLLLLLSVLTAGYLQAEIIFRIAPPKVPPLLFFYLGPGGSAHMEAFFLHRLYHIFPLCAGMTVFLMMGSLVRRELLSFGDLSALSTVTGGKEPRRWKDIVVGFIAVVAVVLGVMSLAGGRPATFPRGFLLPVMLYALWNCFVEELLFRGMIMGSIEPSAGGRWANGIQAVLFALVHMDPGWIVYRLPGLAVLGFVGWFFGRSARETRGIGGSFLMHTALVIAIEMRLTTL